jgi:hypothetical protein
VVQRRLSVRSKTKRVKPRPGILKRMKEPEGWVHGCPLIVVGVCRPDILGVIYCHGGCQFVIPLHLTGSISWNF